MIVLDLPEELSRLESGPIQVGNDDWPGVFIRGDEALYAAFLLRRLLSQNNDSPIDSLLLESLATLLESCKV